MIENSVLAKEINLINKLIDNIVPLVEAKADDKDICNITAIILKYSPLVKEHFLNTKEPFGFYRNGEDIKGAKWAVEFDKNGNLILYEVTSLGSKMFGRTHYANSFSTINDGKSIHILDALRYAAAIKTKEFILGIDFNYVYPTI